jgi:predicted DNA-binding transcriptional regulator YafY
LDDLLKACNEALEMETSGTPGIQKRQLFEDIRFMESPEGYEIVLEKKRDGKGKYYKYADPDFSIRGKGLNESEAAQLKEALLILSRFKGTPQFEWVDEIIARLESSFGLKKNAAKIIEFEQNKYLKGLDNITGLFNAILHKNTLKILYKSFKSDKETQIVFHPYFLKQFNCRWFCFGWNDELSKISNLALDRIISIENGISNYRENAEVDFDDYFEDIVGVTVEGEVKKIIIKVSADLWPYIETKPLHGSQKVKEKMKDGIILQLDLRLNYELESLLLSHGEKMEVLEPIELKKKILARAQAIK